MSYQYRGVEDEIYRGKAPLLKSWKGGKAPLVPTPPVV